MGQTNKQQRHFNEWPIGELLGEVDLSQTRARICKPFKEPSNGFPAWWNQFLGSLKFYIFELSLNYFLPSRNSGMSSLSFSSGWSRWHEQEDFEAQGIFENCLLTYVIFWSLKLKYMELVSSLPCSSLPHSLQIIYYYKIIKCNDEPKSRCCSFDFLDQNLLLYTVFLYLLYTVFKKSFLVAD